MKKYEPTPAPWYFTARGIYGATTFGLFLIGALFLYAVFG